MKYITFNNEECVVVKLTHPTGRPKLVVQTIEGRPMLHPTADIDTQIDNTYVLVKNYSENEGILETFIDNKIVDKPIGEIERYFTKVFICKLLI